MVHHVHSVIISSVTNASGSLTDHLYAEKHALGVKDSGLPENARTDNEV